MERAQVEPAGRRVDAEFVELLKPYHVMQSLFSLNKYRLKNGVAVAVSVRYVFTSIAVNILIFIDCYFVLKILSIPGQSSLGTMSLFYIPNVIGYVFSPCINLLQRKINVKYILKLQEIYRDMKSYLNISDRKYKIFIRYSTIFLIIGSVSLIIFRTLCDPFWNWAKSVITFSAPVFDIEILQCIFYVKFLSNNVSEMTRALNDGRVVVENYNVLEGNTQMFRITPYKFLKLLTNILKAFEMCVTIFQISIFLYLTKVFTQNLAFVRLVIESTKNKEGQDGNETYAYVSHTIGVIVWMVKGLCLAFCLSVVCENMDVQISRIKAACLIMIEKERDHSLQKMAKNVTRLCEVRYTKFNVCGFFTVDATLPLRLLGLVTTYCIVLLQFAFL